MTEVDGDEELRRIHAELGPRWRYNDPRFSEDLPDDFYAEAALSWADFLIGAAKK